MTRATFQRTCHYMLMTCMKGQSENNPLLLWLLTAAGPGRLAVLSFSQQHHHISCFLDEHVSRNQSPDSLIGLFVA